MNAHDFPAELAENDPKCFEKLVELAHFLRSPEGCPWDRKQTALDFARYVREECTELIEALEKPVQDNEHAAEEWGDTFFVLLACLAAAEAETRFTLDQAMRNAYAKMIRRHGHIFGEQEARTAEEAIDVWNQIKQREREAKQVKQED